jgi:hypothetical protein
MKKMRGQAAMEYLMTYGWALIVLTVVIGVLFSMGVFNPQNYMSEECSFQPSLPCRGTSLTEDGALTIVLANGLGYDIKNVYITVDGENSNSADINKGEENTFKIELNENYKPYDVHKFKPVITYEIEGETYTMSGTVTVRASE